MADVVRGRGELRSTKAHTGRVKVFDRVKLVRYSVINEVAIFEGDIRLNRGGETLGIAITGPGVRWPNRTVVFDIDPDMPDPQRVTDAIAHWKNHTVISFKQRTTEGDFMRFQSGDGCSSHVGFVQGVQFVTLGPDCTMGNAIHEIGHVVGLWHEQSRSDRDNFVTIVAANIDPDMLHNFDQHIVDGQDIETYDYGSIMHYPKNAFAIDPGTPTIVTPKGEAIGQREALSAGDIATVAKIYA